MSGISGQQVGFNTTFYKSTLVATKDETNLAAAAVSGNQIIDTTAFGTGLSKERTIIDTPVFGSDVAGKIPGQAELGTFDFSVLFNNDDAIHTAIRDDAGTTQYTFIMKFESGSDITWSAFDGYLAGATLNVAIDSVTSMDVSIARTNDAVHVDKA